MRFYQSFQFTFEPSDRPNVIPSAELQMVGLGLPTKGMGCAVWFTPEQIPQVEQLLGVLWAMKQEQESELEQQFADMEPIWQAATMGKGNGNGTGYASLTEF